MSIEMVNSKKESNPPSQLETYVDGQLESARQQVKFTDLISGLLAMACWILGFLLIGVLVDSWVYQFGPLARVLVFGLLVAGALWIFWKYVASLFLRRISHLYAARMIELGSDNFHNSLINYLHLKQDGKADHQMVVHAISQKAAKDLSAITATEKVDRSWMIRLGFGLTGIVFLLVVYTLFSPKSPWPSMARILNPVTQLSAPSVVTISNVSPGNATVFFGQKLLITADVKGRHEPDLVRLVFSSEDGQHSEVPIKMLASGTGNSYQVELSSSATGIDVPLKYHISAGDGRSPDFNVEVLPTPTIAVKQLEIIPPSYTRLPSRLVTGQAEIEGLEGSKVVLSAVANMPIKVAYVELLKAKSRPDGDASYDVVKTVELQKSDDLNAEGQFFLGLDSKRTNQIYTHYQVRFLTAEGVRNQQLNVSPIRVTADLAPEVKIVRPFEKESNVPFNRYVDFEVQASDLDFEISSVQLRLDHEGSRILDHDVDLPNDQGQQRVNATYRLDPRKLQLAVGDKVLLHALARDNRTSQPLGQPDPNVSRTENYTITIIPPLENELAAATEDPRALDNSSEPSSESSKAQGNEDASSPSNSEANPNANSQAPSENLTSDKDSDSNHDANPAPDRDSEIPGPETDPNEDTPNQSGTTEDSRMAGESNPDSTDKNPDVQSNPGDNHTDQPQTEENDQKQSAQPAENSESQSGDSRQKSDHSPEQSSDSKQGNRSKNPADKSDNPSTKRETKQGNQGNSKSDENPDPGDSDSPQDQSQPQTGDASPQNKSPKREGSDKTDPGKGQNSKQDAGDGSSSKEGQNSDDAASGREKSSGNNGNQNSQPTNTKSDGTGEKSRSQNNSSDEDSTSPGNQTPSAKGSTEESKGNSAMDESATDADRFERLRELVEEMDRQNASKGQSPNKSENQDSTSKETSDKPNSADSQANASPDNSNGNSSNSQKNPSDDASQSSPSNPKQDSTSRKKDDASQNSNNDNSNPGLNPSAGNDSPNDSNQKQNSSETKAGSSNQQSDPQENSQSADSQSANSDSKSKQPKDEGNGKQPAGDKSSAQKGAGDQQPGDQQPGDQKSGDGQPGNGESSDKSPGDSAGNTAGGKPSEESASEQPGDKSSDQSSGQRAEQGNPNSASGPGSDRASNNGQAGSGSSNGPGSEAAAAASKADRKSTEKSEPSNSGQFDRPADENAQRQSGSSNSKQLGNGTLSGQKQGDIPDNADPSEGDLSYAREATDLILDHLKNQANNPDPKLLEQMNWTEQDLRDFLARWEEMKSKAKSSSAVERRRYDDALRSLNLRPESVRRNVLKSQRDKLNKLSEDGAVNRPPPELADEFNSFLKNRNRVEKSK